MALLAAEEVALRVERGDERIGLVEAGARVPEKVI